MVRQDIKKELKIPLILTTIFFVLSFVPLVQVLILTFDGGLISVINKVVGEDKTGNIWAANILANLLPTLLLLFVFFKATKQSTKVITATLSMIFMTAFIFFLTDGIYKDSDPYLLNFIVVALISGSVLTLVSILKYRLVKSRQTLV